MRDNRFSMAYLELKNLDEISQLPLPEASRKLLGDTAKRLVSWCWKQEKQAASIIARSIRREL